MKDKNYNEFCSSMECIEYIEWDFGHGLCISCKKMGESYDITDYPEDCNFIDKIRDWEERKIKQE
jgi:hypothetical protein